MAIKIKVCTCTKELPGSCRERELSSRKILLSDEAVRSSDWGGGFNSVLEAASHNWWDWAFPDHDEDICDEFNVNARIVSTVNGCWRIYVFDLEDQIWTFDTGPLNPADFPNTEDE